MDMKTKTLLVNNLLTNRLSDASVKCHITEERLTLWKFLNDHASLNEDDYRGRPIVSIVGPPGIGKSVIAYAWTIWYATHFKKRTLYVQGIHLNFELVSIVENRVTRCSIKYTHDSEVGNIHNVINNMHKDNCYDLVVSDGDNPNLNKFLFQRLTNTLVVTVSSFQTFSELSQRLMVTRKQYRHIVLSWTKEEIIEANNSGNLPVPLDELEERMFYSGTCIRWLLSEPTQAKLHIDMQMNSVENYNQLLCGKIGDKSLDEVNSLLSLPTIGRSTILSEYIVRVISEKATDSLVPLCRNVLPENLVWQGLVTKLEVLHMIHTRPTLHLWDKNGNHETWETSLKRTIIDENDSSIRPTQSRGWWLIPSYFNQGCFDALYIKLDGTLVVFQITDAIKHDYKLKVLVPLVKKLKCFKIEFVVICRITNLLNYRVIKSELKNLRDLNLALQSNFKEKMEEFTPFGKDDIRCVTYQSQSTRRVAS
jgi:hypothetical protein